MKRKLLLSLTLFMISLFFISSAFADWTLIEQTGSWVTCERNYWKTANGWNEGTALWRYGNISDFTGYYAEISFPVLECYKEFWSMGDDKKFDIWLNFTGNNTQVHVQIEAEDYLWFFILHYLGWRTGVNINQTEYLDTPELGARHPFSHQGHVSVMVFRSDSNLKILVYDYMTLYDDPYLILNKTVNVGDQWFENVYLEMYVKHIGRGQVEGYLLYEDLAFTEPSSFPQEKEIVGTVFDAFIHGLFEQIGAIPKWISDMAISLKIWLNWCIDILAIAWSAVSWSFPFFPAIILFWIVDAIGTSIHEGDLHPIGNCFMAIYNFARAVISTIVAIIGRIWDFITFWS